MKYVLDASVAIKWVFVEPDSKKATRMREDYRNAVHDLIAPESFAIECAYSLTKKQRQRLLPDARALWDDIMLDAPAFTPILSLVDRAHEFQDWVRSSRSRQTRINLRPTFPPPPFPRRNLVVDKKMASWRQLLTGIGVTSDDIFSKSRRSTDLLTWL
jgi:hypothetical protein